MIIWGLILPHSFLIFFYMKMMIQRESVFAPLVLDTYTYIKDLYADVSVAVLERSADDFESTPFQCFASVCFQSLNFLLRLGVFSWE